MSDLPDWLPPALDYADYNGAWDNFLLDVYAAFKRDFINSRPQLEGFPVVFDGRISDGMEEGFWHVTSQTDREIGERVQDFRRCERIVWLRPIIEHPDEETISFWKNRRGKEIRLLLWLEAFDYLVVLSERPRVRVLVTAYCTDREHIRRKLRQERDEASKANAASSSETA
jgi:hypothetical protein